jgi:hypothetical protein
LVGELKSIHFFLVKTLVGVVATLNKPRVKMAISHNLIAILYWQLWVEAFLGAIGGEWRLSKSSPKQLHITQKKKMFFY